MKKIFLTGLVAFSLAASSWAQSEVSAYTPGITADGITYFLPQTGLHVTLTATRTTYKPGEYAIYADRYLRLKNVPQEEYDVWELKGIVLTPYGEADKTKAYSIKFKQKTSLPLVSLASDGRLLAVNTDKSPAEVQLSRPSVTPDNKKQIKGEDFKTEEILAAGSMAKMAELTAEEIYDIRENRTYLTKGQADFMPKDGEQLRLMLAKLDTQEEGLLQLFKGSSSTETHVLTLDYVPSGNVEKEILFRFSPQSGLVDADDVSGIPYYISVTDLQAVPPVQVDPKAKQPKEIYDLRYHVPGKVSVKIFTDRSTNFTGTFSMGQYGRVEHLGGDLFNKKFTTRVYLSPETGAITKIDADMP